MRQRNDNRRAQPYDGGAMDASGAALFQMLGQWTIADVLNRYPALVRPMLTQRIACVGCALARFETVSEAAAHYPTLVSIIGQLDQLDQIEAREDSSKA